MQREITPLRLKHVQYRYTQGTYRTYLRGTLQAVTACMNIRLYWLIMFIEPSKKSIMYVKDTRYAVDSLLSSNRKAIQRVG